MTLGFIILGTYFIIAFLFHRLFVTVIPDKEETVYDYDGFRLDELKRSDYVGMSAFWPVLVIGSIICIIISLFDYDKRRTNT